MNHTVLKEDVIQIINEHNKKIDDFINGELAVKLGAKNGCISLNMWFKAQELIKEERFYEKGMDLLHFFRNDGWDVKINCQANTLIFYGEI